MGTYREPHSIPYHYRLDILNNNVEQRLTLLSTLISSAFDLSSNTSWSYIRLSIGRTLHHPLINFLRSPFAV